jgi:hypothetical protein
VQLFGWIVGTLALAFLVLGWLLGRLRFRWAGVLSLGGGIAARLGGGVVLFWESVNIAERGWTWLRLLAAAGLVVLGAGMLFSAALLFGGLLVYVRQPERFEAES